MIDKSMERVLLKLAKIDALNHVDEKITALKAYGKGLAETGFKALFMVILSGELRKRWQPMVEETILASGVHVSSP